jgi:tyrosyl-tRNA synthetase
MFGKAMSISDELMARWYSVLLGKPLDPSTHPMEAKKHLAASLVRRFHNEAAAAEARQDFELKFSKKDLAGADMPTWTPSENPIWIVKALQENGAVKSGGDARRLIAQGAVRLNGEKIADDKAKVALKTGDVLQSGKKHFVRIG